MSAALNALLTWLLRRRVTDALLVSVVAALLCVLASGAVATPQLRGPSVEMGSMVVCAIVLGCATSLAVHAPDQDLELTSSRPMAQFRVGVALALLIGNAGLLLLVGEITASGASSSLAALRTMALVAGVTVAVTRVASFVAAASVLLGYLGCVLFAGVSPSGQAEPWARVLSPWESPVDAWLIAIGALLAVLGFATVPRQAGVSFGRTRCR